MLFAFVTRNVFRYRQRSLLTILSITVSIFIFAMLLSLPSLVRRVLSDPATAQRLVVHSKGGFFYMLPHAYLDRIASVKHVDVVVGEQIFLATYRDPRDEVPALALDPERVEQLWSDWGISSAVARNFRKERTAALVGKILMRRFGWKLGDHVILRGTTAPVQVDLTITGTIGGTAPGYVLMFRRDLLDEALGRPGTVNIFWVRVDNSNAIPGVIHDIDQMFANSAYETATESETSMAESRLGEMRLLFDGVKVLAVIVVVSIGFVAANAAAMSVRARRREFAVLRAIGFTKFAVVGLTSAEGVVIGFTGGCLGCLAAYAGLKAVVYASRSLGFFAYAMFLPASNIALGIIVAILLGMISSFLPIVLEMRSEIANELRAA